MPLAQSQSGHNLFAGATGGVGRRENGLGFRPHRESDSTSQCKACLAQLTRRRRSLRDGSNRTLIEGVGTPSASASASASFRGGVIATSIGNSPTATVIMTVLLAVSITETLLESPFVT